VGPIYLRTGAVSILDVFGGVMNREDALGSVDGECGGEKEEDEEGVNVAFGD
jgi:hypothetical protein